jgi:hypothetical protein
MADVEPQISCDIAELEAEYKKREEKKNLREVIIGESYGGTYYGTHGSVVGHNDLSTSFTLVVKNDLTVDGLIYAPMQNQPHEAVANITLVSLEGRVLIKLGAAIGYGYAAPGANKDETPTRQQLIDGVEEILVLSDGGTKGGYIKIRGVSIEIDGHVHGISGGKAGDATARGFPTAAQARVAGGIAVALGINGGAGGDVVLCAAEAITLTTNAWVVGSMGGEGGDAKAIADCGAEARARGGDGGAGGNIFYTGTGKQPCRVTIDGITATQMDLTPGMTGGNAYAQGGNGRILTHNTKLSGGKAEAIGGYGSDGGKIVFINCTVTKNGSISAGRGGRGGNARAQGGTGGSKNNFAHEGGDASAKGGTGGDPGTIVGVAGAAGKIVTDGLRAYSAAMKAIGNSDRQEVGRGLMPSSPQAVDRPSW